MYRVVIAAFLLLSPASAAEVSISGREFLLDGNPWVAEGVVLVGLLAPIRQPEPRPAYDRAYDSYGPEMLEDIREFGADLIRLKVNEIGLDPQSDKYLADYREEVIDVIQEMRQAEFVVLVSMLRWDLRRDLSQPNMPDERTSRAWAELLPDIGQDKGVMLELFDEPNLKQANPRTWEAWRAATQPVVDSVRAAGSENVILIGGLRNAKIIQGAPAIDDPLGQLGYAVHPYLVRRGNERHEWDAQFGDFAATRPVMATEWNALSNREAQCDTETPERVQEFFSYLREKRIGLVLWAFDLPGVRSRDGDLTSFEGHRCGEGTLFGAGEAVRDYFAAY